MLLSVILLCALVFVNGWTDAPNSIATCVGCGVMKLRKAATLAAAMNMLGTIVAVSVSGSIMTSMMNIVSVGEEYGELVMCVAMFTVITWSTIAWIFGLPTSESHSLVSALSGSALAVCGSVSAAEWQKVIVGLLMSVALGGGAGYVFATLGKRIVLNEKRTKNAVKIASALMAFSHGAGDGQKFVGVFLLMLDLEAKNDGTSKLIATLSVALLMLLGTMLGGKRIINTVTKKMTKLEPKTALYADLGGATCVLISSILGIPISTTHSKMTSVMGVSVVGDTLDFKSAKGMFFAWVLTFPISFSLAYLLTFILR